MRILTAICLMFAGGNVLGADIPAKSDAKLELDRSLVCAGILSDASSFRSEILLAQSMIADNAKRRSNATAEEKEKLHQSSLRWEEEIRSAYSALASVVTVYTALECHKSDLVSEMHCPEGWSDDCR